MLLGMQMCDILRKAKIPFASLAVSETETSLKVAKIIVGKIIYGKCNFLTTPDACLSVSLLLFSLNSLQCFP